MKLVSVVLATYRPNMEYFEKLLCSLNRQTYANVHVIIRDDSADESVFDDVANMIKRNITRFKYTIYKNTANLGSNQTFELLTEDADGEYIAYCDQDDIWEADKISRLVKRLEDEQAALCYSDLSVIDENDRLIANSFRDINIRLKHIEGSGIFQYFLRRNSVSGCTMLIKSDVAKQAIPFCHKYYVHDHWLTLYASSVGKISYVREPLIKYRIHGNNQIGSSMLKGITSREDYYNYKLLKEKEKYVYLLREYDLTDDQEAAIHRVLNWTETRIRFFEKRDLRNTLLVLGQIREDYQLIGLEIIINLAPNRISELLLNKIRS